MNHNDTALSNLCVNLKDIEMHNQKIGELIRPSIVIVMSMFCFAVLTGMKSQSQKTMLLPGRAEEVSRDSWLT